MKEPTKESDMITIYCYDGQYKNADGVPTSVIVESLDKLENMEYDSVGFVLADGKESYITVLSYLPIEKNKCELAKYTYLPSSEPEAEEKPILNQDIVPRLIQFIDDEIYRLCGDRIHGMIDVKFAFIVQKFTHIFGWPKFYNIALVGKNDSGKTYISDRYGTFLYGPLYKRAVAVVSLSRRSQEAQEATETIGTAIKTDSECSQASRSLQLTNQRE
jgi:hypothetical protein